MPFKLGRDTRKKQIIIQIKAKRNKGRNVPIGVQTDRPKGFPAGRRDCYTNTGRNFLMQASVTCNNTSSKPEEFGRGLAGFWGS